MLILGVVFVAAAGLALAILVPAFRAPEPPRWTQSKFLGEAITVGIVGAFALGIANLVAGAYRASQSGIGLWELALVAGVSLGAVVAWRALRRQAPKAAVPTAPRPAAVSSLGPSAGHRAPPEPPPSRPSRPTRRAA